MLASVQKWGNSLGIRLPKVFLNNICISENDKVELKQEGNSIIIKKIKPVHRSLEERLLDFYGKPIDDIQVPPSDEYDWGEKRGNEIW